MLFYIVLDFLVGFIPFLGDLFDVGYRANTRIAWLLNDHLVDEAIENLRSKTGRPSDTNEPKNRDLERGIVRHIESPAHPTMLQPARTAPQRIPAAPNDTRTPPRPKNPPQTKGRRR